MAAVTSERIREPEKHERSDELRHFGWRATVHERAAAYCLRSFTAESMFFPTCSMGPLPISLS